MEKQIDLVKRKLWTFGYSVKDVSNAGLTFDLIVNDRMYCKVRILGERKINPKNIVVANVDHKNEISYEIYRSNKWEREESPLKAFPKVKN